jgi:acetyl-CoA carboxylase biotin carboxyl carrier protein
MDKKDVLEILEKFNQSGLAEIRFRQGDDELILKRWASQTGVPAAPMAPIASHVVVPEHNAAPIATPSTQSKPESAPIASSNVSIITAPIVGTFYRAAAPDAPAFVEEGQEVKKGQVLCILEAMKNMNQLEAEFDCIIQKILVTNGTLVEYGAALFEVIKK